MEEAQNAPNADYPLSHGTAMALMLSRSPWQ